MHRDSPPPHDRLLEVIQIISWHAWAVENCQCSAILPVNGKLHQEPKWPKRLWALGAPKQGLRLAVHLCPSYSGGPNLK